MTIAIASRVGASEFPATAPTVTMRSAKQPPLGVGSTATSIHAPHMEDSKGGCGPIGITESLKWPCVVQMNAWERAGEPWFRQRYQDQHNVAAQEGNENPQLLI